MPPLKKNKFSEILAGPKSLAVIEMFEKYWNAYFTGIRRPMRSALVGTSPDELFEEASMGLVIQGPVVKKLDFTLETIRIYKKHFRNTRIILSTWDSEDWGYLEKIRAEQVEVILNKEPLFPGTSNINRQIISSFAGVKMAANAGCEYVLKTRTDQRIYAPNAKEHLINLIKAFPVKTKGIQRGRIIGVSLNTFKYRLYGLSDMVTFGHAEDLMRFWSCNLDAREVRPETIDYRKPMRDVARMAIAEVYLTSEFLKKTGWKPLWTLEDSWLAMAERFCVIDQQSLDLFWLKYDHFREYRWLQHEQNLNSQELNFSEWLNIHVSMQNKRIPERAITAGFKEKYD